jgi:hypothetical protein
MFLSAKRLKVMEETVKELLSDEKEKLLSSKKKESLLDEKKKKRKGRKGVMWKRQDEHCFFQYSVTKWRIYKYHFYYAFQIDSICSSLLNSPPQS